MLQVDVVLNQVYYFNSSTTNRGVADTNDKYTGSTVNRTVLTHANLDVPLKGPTSCHLSYPPP